MIRHAKTLLSPYYQLQSILSFGAISRLSCLLAAFSFIKYPMQYWHYINRQNLTEGRVLQVLCRYFPLLLLTTGL